jgi:hypothetical protein
VPKKLRQRKGPACEDLQDLGEADKTASGELELWMPRRERILAGLAGLPMCDISLALAGVRLCSTLASSDLPTAPASDLRAAENVRTP